MICSAPVATPRPLEPYLLDLKTFTPLISYVNARANISRIWRNGF
jgi:hypothetical protein